MFIFNIQDIRGKEITSHSQGYEYLKIQGMKVIDNYQICHSFEEVWKAIEMIGESRDQLGLSLIHILCSIIQNNKEYIFEVWDEEDNEVTQKRYELFLQGAHKFLDNI